MDEIVPLRPAPNRPSPHIDIRFDVHRETAISAQWNVGKTHLIVTFGDFKGNLRLMLTPHAVQRLTAALPVADQEYRKI